MRHSVISAFVFRAHGKIICVLINPKHHLVRSGEIDVSGPRNSASFFEQSCKILCDGSFLSCLNVEFFEDADDVLHRVFDGKLTVIRNIQFDKLLVLINALNKPTCNGLLLHTVET